MVDKQTDSTKRLLMPHAIRMARLYAYGVGLISVIGLAAAAVLLLELATPRPDVLDGSRFGALLTLHGTVMVFLVLVPLIPGIIGNAVIPHGVGAKDTAWPAVNLAAWVLYVVGAIAAMVGIELGGYDGGWRMILPPEFGAEGAFICLVLGLIAVAVSSGLLNLVLARTTLSKRYRTTAMSSLPLYVWYFLLALLVQMIVLPARLWFLLAEGAAAISDSMAALLVPGDASIFIQHLFWVYANPMILSVLLFALGVVTALIEKRNPAINSARRKLLFGGTVLSVLILFSWGQNLLTASNSTFLAAAGSMYSLLTIIPAFLVLVVLIRASLLRSGGASSDSASLIGLFVLILVLLLTGAALATPGLGVYLHDTYMTVAHLHLGSVGIGLLSFVSGIVHWWPLFSHRVLPARHTIVSIWAMIAGLFLAFLPLLFLGIKGVPRSYHEYSGSTQLAHVISAAGGLLFLVSVAYWLVLLWRGGRAKARTSPLVREQAI